MRASTPMAAAAAVALGAVVPAAVAGDSSAPEVKPSTQSVGDSSRIITPTWKTYTSSTGGGSKIVVSTGGNITGFASPTQSGRYYEHIGVGTVGEGYVLCYNGSGANYDVGYASAGFAAPTTNSTSVTRNTLDGRASLIQTFNLTHGGAGGPSNFLVQMNVVNRTNQPMSNVVIRRQVDFDIDTGGAQGWAGFQSNHGRTKGTVSAFHDPVEAPTGRESHGIMMMIQTGGNWETRVTDDILDTSCNPTPAPMDANYVSRGDYGDTIIWRLGSIPARGSKAVAMRYMRY